MTLSRRCRSFYLLLALHAWMEYRETGRERYVAVCCALMLLLAFTKETYFLSALCPWAFEAVLRQKKQRQAAGNSAGRFAGAVHCGRDHEHVFARKCHPARNGHCCAHHASLAPANLFDGVVFYSSHLFPVVALLAVAAAFALARVHRLEALGIS